MGYRRYDPAGPRLIGYDPATDLPPDHLARLIDQVVDETITPTPRPAGPGQPPYDPRLCVKVLLYAYATGVRSSRRIELLCYESLPFLLLTRGDTPSYRTLSTARKTLAADLEAVWEGLFAVAEARGLTRLGKVVVDTSRWRANAGREATVNQEELPEVLAELRRILEEAETTDRAEEREEPRNEPRLGQAVPPDQLRDILRRVRKKRKARQRAEAETQLQSEPAGNGEPSKEEAPPPGDTPPPPAGSTPATPSPAPTPPHSGSLTRAMRRRFQVAIELLERLQETAGKRVNLTDPDAEFMRLGAEKKLGLGHSFEAAVDQGLLVTGQRGEGVTDNSRLEPILAAARLREPQGITHVDADSGFYQGEPIGKLLQQGVDVCIPDANTAGDLHRGRLPGERHSWRFFTWDAKAGCFRCQNGNELRPVQTRQQHGQQWTVYRAKEPCASCPHATECLQRADASHRTVHVGQYHPELEAARLRFRDAAHQARYRQRGPAIETVFAFLEHVLGYRRWWLRGKDGVAAEARWLALAYQVRKVHLQVKPA